MNLGPYEVLSELGRGAMGIVYRARRADLDREFALKVLDPAAAASPEARERFQREARAAAALAGHPHIVAVHDVGEGFVASHATNPLSDARRAAPELGVPGAAHDARPLPYLAMDLVRGESLAARLASADLPPAATLEIGLAVARALAHAHAAGVVHRDVKPANILLATDGRVCLTDFGLARPVDPAATARLTRSGEILGTPAYMAPEQVRGEAVDGRADVYALGATLYEIAAGAPPFEDATVAGLLARVLRDRPVPLAHRAPHLPAPLAAIVDRCLEKSAADRYPSAAALVADLERGARGEPARLAPLPLLARAARGVRGRRGLAALGLAAVVGGVAAAWHVARRSGDSATTATRDAERETQAAEQAVRASAVFEALVRRTSTAMRLLEDRFQFAPVDPAEAGAALADVEAAVAHVAAEYPGAPLPRAWRALARFLAGHPDGLAPLEAARTAREDPFPLLLYAQAALLTYARDVELPLPSLEKDRSTPAGFRESPDVAAARRAATAALHWAAEHPLWPHLTHGAAHRQFAAAAARFGEEDFAGAAADLEPLTHDPLLGGAASLLHALAHYARRRFDVAAQAWERVAERRWPRAITCAGIAHLAAANEQLGVDESPLAGYDHAIAAFDRVLAWAPDDGVARRWRGTARRARAEARRWRREPPWDDFAGALADLDAVLAVGPVNVETVLARAHTRWTLADAEEVFGRDPRASYRGAISDYDAAIAADPDEPRSYHGRGIAWRGLGIAEARFGGDPWPAFDRAVGDHRDADARGGGVVALTAEVADWLERAKAEQAAGLDPSATFDAGADAAERAAAAGPDDADAAQSGAALYHFRARARFLAGGDARADASRAVALATRGLELKPGFLPFYTLCGQASAMLAAARERAGEDPGPAFRQALASMDSAIAKDATDATLVYTRGAIWMTIGDAAAGRGEDAAAAFARSVADLTEAGRLAPHLWQAHVQLVQLLQRLGREADARAALARALAAAPDSPEVRALAAGFEPK